MQEVFDVLSFVSKISAFVDSAKADAADAADHAAGICDQLSVWLRTQAKLLRSAGPAESAELKGAVAKLEELTAVQGEAKLPFDGRWIKLAQAFISFIKVILDK